MLFNCFLSLFLVGNTVSISEINYNQTYVNEVNPFFFSTPQRKFPGKDGIKINYWMRLSPSHSTSNPSKALIVAPARNAPLRNYAELFYDLNNEPYNLDLSFYILDHRGQGGSEKVGAADVSDVKDFNDYVEDLENFYSFVVSENMHSVNIILGDGMGGLVASLAMNRNPATFQAAILSSPMYGLNRHYPKWFAESVTSVATFLGFGSSHALGQKSFGAQNFPMSEAVMTSSAARYYMAQSFVVADPRKQIGGVSNRWVKESLKACSYFSRQKLPISTVMLSAGMEMIVDPKAEEKICQQSLYCNRKVFEHSYHEILFERDEIRDESLEIIAKFINNAL